jgi:hypothetical protein
MTLASDFINKMKSINESSNSGIEEEIDNVCKDPVYDNWQLKSLSPSDQAKVKDLIIKYSNSGKEILYSTFPLGNFKDSFKQYRKDNKDVYEGDEEAILSILGKKTKIAGDISLAKFKDITFIVRDQEVLLNEKARKFLDHKDFFQKNVPAGTTA